MKQHTDQMVQTKAAVARLKRFGWNMITLGGSMGLYYLGFFNSTQGPLNSDKIGTYLNDMGITGNHLLAILVLLFLISIAWNWVYNLIYFKFYRKFNSKVSTKPQLPVHKGPWGHALWMAFLIIVLCVILNLV